MTGTKGMRRRRRGLMIQPRDLVLLGQLWIMRVADRDQLMIASGFHSITRINARLLALTRAGLLRRFFIGFGGGRKALYAISAKAAQLIEKPLRGPRRRQDELLAADFSVIHQLSINDIYCSLKFRPIPVPGVTCVNWMGFTEPVIQDSRLIPDGYVEFSTPAGIDAAFIEVDLGHENLTIWKEKAKRYLQFAISGEFTRRFSQPRFRVLVLANSVRRMHSIRGAIAQMTEKIFWFAALEDARGDTFFGPVWLRPVGNSQQPLFEQPR
jgi:hypothetical protein